MSSFLYTDKYLLMSNPITISGFKINLRELIYILLYDVLKNSYCRSWGLQSKPTENRSGGILPQ